MNNWSRWTGSMVLIAALLSAGEGVAQQPTKRPRVLTNEEIAPTPTPSREKSTEKSAEKSTEKNTEKNTPNTATPSTKPSAPTAPTAPTAPSTTPTTPTPPATGSKSAPSIVAAPAGTNAPAVPAPAAATGGTVPPAPLAKAEIPPELAAILSYTAPGELEQKIFGRGGVVRTRIVAERRDEVLGVPGLEAQYSLFDLYLQAAKTPTDNKVKANIAKLKADISRLPLQVLSSKEALDLELRQLYIGLQIDLVETERALRTAEFVAEQESRSPSAANRRSTQDEVTQFRQQAKQIREALKRLAIEGRKLGASDRALQ